ncbi:dihydrodipicolinate synthase family protein [Hymenobacter busanensis]|uniref:Dihydrodipicolinate synthase family protein n=2 Tax=Hymenobacter busanensis TaxID=2607656 RepID=A0A7L4ZUA9_9BACT|nr:dihydrodipicolinate synthase family protein [Hymenobacter busanensis]KAA9339482.1 dihydrodipicolinate synthase family protein [Hymenobacter busanensis]QHJ06761.1 dihydrodipicolinate synthase family protein [Hymenobacter busanensis]
MEKSRKGFVPVMLMPFQNDGLIDYPALTRLTELYLKAGATGLFANCLSSEMFELSAEERLQSIRHVVDVVGGEVPVVATGTFAGSLPEQADFVKQVYDAGTEAVIVITGLLAAETEPDAVFNERVFELLDRTPGIPLGFYECPEPYKRLLSAEQLHQFVGTGRVIYHKDTCLDINQIRQKLAAVQGASFGLYDAYMGHAVESLKAGAAGLSCIQGNFFPELIVWLCNNYDNAYLTEEVAAVQQFFVKNMHVMHNVYPVVAKYSLKQRGIDISTFTRRKVGTFSSSVRKGVENLCYDYSNLRKDLEWAA